MAVDVSSLPVGLAPQARRRAIEEWAELSEAHRAGLAACDPILWAMYASRGAWFTAPHLEYLADVLLEVVRGESLRVAVSMPPQHGKTELLSVYFPSWFAGRFPEARVLQVSYGQDLTVDWTARGRDLFAEHGPAVFGLDTWSRSKRAAWSVYRDGRRTGGGVRGVGKGGVVAGRPMDLGILDDMIKDQEEADSTAQRNRNYKWLRSVVFPRVKRLINLGTRWSHDDHVGRLMAAQKRGEVGERWKFVNIPAVSEGEGDPLGRPKGVPLWLANPLCMGDPDWYRKKELDVGPHIWSALYQGRPTPVTGNLYQTAWIRYFDEEAGYLVADRVRVAGAALFRFVTVDPAWSTKTSADWSVVASWGLDRENGRLFLLDLDRRRMTAPDLAQSMRDALARSGATVIYIEAQNLKLDEMNRLRVGLPMREIQPNTDKVARFMPVTAVAARGDLLFRRNAPWLAELEAELLEFGPGCQHDDQVDAVSYAVNVALTMRTGFGVIPPPPKRHPDEDEEQPDRWNWTTRR